MSKASSSALPFRLDGLMIYDTVEDYIEAEPKGIYGGDWLPKIPQKRNGALNLRRNVPIHAYVGPNGGGKSLAMVNDTIQTLNGVRWECENMAHEHARRGVFSGWRHVLSTVELLDPRTGKPHPLYIPYNDHRQLLLIEHADILMDEIQGVASSQAGGQLPTQINNVLLQLRRRDCNLRWTTPNWAAGAKRIREVTKAVTYCTGYLRMYEKGRSWPSNSFFVWKTYDASMFEMFTVGTRERLAPMNFQSYMRPFKHNVAMDLYNTLDEVLSLNSYSANGMCLHCGGIRRIEKCICDHEKVDSVENLSLIGDSLGIDKMLRNGLAEIEAGGATAPALDSAEDAEDCDCSNLPPELGSFSFKETSGHAG